MLLEMIYSLTHTEKERGERVRRREGILSLYTELTKQEGMDLNLIIMIDPSLQSKIACPFYH